MLYILIEIKKKKGIDTLFKYYFNNLKYDEHLSNM